MIGQDAVINCLRSISSTQRKSVRSFIVKRQSRINNKKGDTFQLVMFIYKITNTTNGDFYIGKTTQSMEKRFSDHKYNTRYDKVKDTHLYRAMRKYGVDVFIIEALESQVPEEKLNERNPLDFGTQPTL